MSPIHRPEAVAVAVDEAKISPESRHLSGEMLGRYVFWTKNVRVVAVTGRVREA
jgi:hypothetical protein